MYIFVVSGRFRFDNVWKLRMRAITVCPVIKKARLSSLFFELFCFLFFNGLEMTLMR